MIKPVVKQRTVVAVFSMSIKRKPREVRMIGNTTQKSCIVFRRYVAKPIFAIKGNAKRTGGPNGK
jgi:hypothetical protein